MRTTNFSSRWFIVVLILLSAALLNSCTLTSGNQAKPVSRPGGTTLSILEPQAGRDAALDFIKDTHGVDLPIGTGNWSEKNITPNGVTTSAAYEYTSGNWIASIIYRIVDPSEILYRVTVANNLGFDWEGEVDAYGSITETAYKPGQLQEQGTATHAPPPVPTRTPTLTPTPEIFLQYYSDSSYRLEFQYPSSWSLSTLPAGRNIGTSFAAKTLELIQDDMKLVVQYKFPWEITTLETIVPAGKIEIRRTVTLFGQEYPLKFVVDGEKVLYMFFNATFDDLEFHFHLETTTLEIPVSPQIEAEQIIASLVRTGDPFPSPTVQFTLSPTPKPIGTSSGSGTGSGSGSTETQDCNRANFISHVTIPEGTVLPPGVTFIKTWRIQNAGTCAWTTAYRLVFSEGDLMGADKSVPLTASVSPGSSIDISVEMTAPGEEGQYQGYWILNDDQGNPFGLGDQKNGLIPVDIRVVIPEEIYAYDFGINYCDASWVNNHDQTLPCPGDSGSTNGFVVLLANPKLENRQENELALWVHPYEERYGWIQGLYPAYRVVSGDHFMAWVGCMADSSKCSIKFSLDYLEKGGKIVNLGSWTETYDGEITMIDLDLTQLAGKRVRFILTTEALTENFTAAQGFWFVPRIESP
jgi:hypothetical protein